MKELQRKAVKFAEENDLESPVEYRALDFISEAGEIVKDITKSADYGESPENIQVKEDEVGDVMFSLFLLADSLDIDAEEAFSKAMKKYQKRVEDSGDPGSK